MFALLFIFVFLGGFLGNITPTYGETKQSRQLQHAIKLHDKLQFNKALKVLNSLVQDPYLKRKQRARAYLYQGFCIFYLKGAKVARVKILIALRLDPYSVLPKQTPPPLRQLFNRERKKALAYLKTRPPVRRKFHLPNAGHSQSHHDIKLKMNAMTPIKPGQLIQFEGTCSPHLKNGRVSIFIRQEKTTTYLKYPLQWRGTRCFGKIPNPYPLGYKENGHIEFVVAMKNQKNQLVEQSHPFHHPAQIPLQSSKNSWLIPTIIVASIATSAAIVTVIILATPPPSGVNVYIKLSDLRSTQNSSFLIKKNVITQQK